jgi:FtsP/CotA-like multicopper oxidase with cupredoxin domain
VRPTIRIDPGEPQFFRIINATGHRTLDLSLDGRPLQIVAFDGYPIDTNPKNPPALTVTHVVVPPAGRVEFVATGTSTGELRTLCYDAGPVGDPDPPEILAHLRPETANGIRAAATPLTLRAGRIAPSPLSAPLPPPAATRLVRFSEDQVGYFYINGQRFSLKAPPMFVVHVGTVERWRIENETNQIHDFHLHQVHFVVESENGVAPAHPFWRDSVVVPPRHKRADGTWVPGAIELIADFRNPIIRGTFLFHCHILDHEDLGMMAKIQAI